MGVLHGFQDDIRERLDGVCCSEITIVWGIPAVVEIAKAMVNLKLIKAPRASPNKALKAKPKYW